MAVTRNRNIIALAAGDVAIHTGVARILAVTIVAGAAAARIKLFDGVNDVSGFQAFEWGDVPLSESDGIGGLKIDFQNGISATFTGAGAAAWIDLE